MYIMLLEQVPNKTYDVTACDRNLLNKTPRDMQYISDSSSPIDRFWHRVCEHPAVTSRIVYR